MMENVHFLCKFYEAERYKNPFKTHCVIKKTHGCLLEKFFSYVRSWIYKVIQMYSGTKGLRK